MADTIAAEHAGRWPLQRVGNNLVFGGPSGPGRPLHAFFGHLDTVPGDTHAPIVTPESLIALGASDMKAGLAIMATLMAERAPGDAPYDLAFVFYDREEGPYLESGLRPILEAIDWKHLITFAFCLEPSANRLQLGCLGTLHARLVFHGRGAHSARPWEGENAIHKAGALLARLHGRPPVDVSVGALLYREVMSVTLAEGGSARNVVPDRLVLNLNYRFAPGKSLEVAQAEVRALAPEADEVSFPDLCPSGAVPVGHPSLALLLGPLGLVPEAKQAWTDVARLSLAGIPAVNLGPGEPSQAHQKGEFVPWANLDAGLDLFRRYLAALG